MYIHTAKYRRARRASWLAGCPQATGVPDRAAPSTTLAAGALAGWEAIDGHLEFLLSLCSVRKKDQPQTKKNEPTTGKPDHGRGIALPHSLGTMVHVLLE